MHHHHEHHHEQTVANLGRAYVIGILLNSGFVAVEFITGFFYDSMGLLADAGHNLSDVGSLVISMIAFWLATRGHTQNYTYGFRKATIHASLLNAVILLIAIGMIIMECIQKFRHPVTVGGWPIIITAGVGIMVNGVTVLLFTRDKDRDLNVKGAYLHMLADTLVSVGVVFSGVIILFTGWTMLDPLVGLVIAVVILSSGWSLMRESVRLSLDGVPKGIDPAELRDHILENENVLALHHLHVWPISTTENALTAHLVLRDISIMEKTKRELHEELAEHGISHSTLEFESRDTHCTTMKC